MASSPESQRNTHFVTYPLELSNHADTFSFVHPGFKICVLEISAVPGTQNAGNMY